MVAGPAAADAVARARRLPGLQVGLHLVLVEGDSVLGHQALPHITGADGRFGANQAALGVKYFFSPQARRELDAEIRAQFAAFRATGLALHHVDAHKHMHLHPTVAAKLLAIGQEFGVARVRVPREPPSVLVACGYQPRWGDYALHLWSSVLRAQVRQAGLACDDQVFGIAWSGQMTEARVRRLLDHLPPGQSEIYFHPALGSDPTLQALMPNYQHQAEFEALLGLKYPI